MNRSQILELWHRKRAGGQTLQGGPEGPDFLTVSNVDRVGLPKARGIAGLLPIGDANRLSLEAARERVPGAGKTPVIAGVCATDPMRLLDKFLLEMKDVGVAGVMNLPSVGIFEGGFRANLEGSELGYAREVELVRLARQLGLVAAGIVFSAPDARLMAQAGADLVVVHPGLGSGAGPRDRARRVEECAQAARELQKELFVLAYGPPAPEVAALDGIQIE